jgi:hypothetical protein
VTTQHKKADVLEARIQHALAPYVGRLTPDALAEARRLLTVTLTTHPVLAPLVEQLQGPAEAGASGGVATEEPAAAGRSGVVAKEDPAPRKLPAAKRRRGRKG